MRDLLAERAELKATLDRLAPAWRELREVLNGTQPGARDLRPPAVLPAGHSASTSGGLDLTASRDDYGVSEWKLTGTTPDGTHLDVLGCDFLTILDDKIVRKNSFRKQSPAV